MILLVELQRLNASDYLQINFFKCLYLYSSKWNFLKKIEWIQENLFYWIIIISVNVLIEELSAQSDGAIEYTNCIFTAG